MVNQSKLDMEDNLISIIEEFMVQYDGTLVLKTTPVSVIHNGRGSLNTSGNQGLASAGTGDVLAGCIGSFIAQGVSPFDAGKLGVFIHGKAADSLLDQTGYRGMTATDVINEVPKVIREYEIGSLQNYSRSIIINTITPQPIYRQDYQPSNYLIHTTKLSFELLDNETIVSTKIHFYKNPKSQQQHNNVFLDGVDLELISITIKSG